MNARTSGKNSATLILLFGFSFLLLSLGSVSASTTQVIYSFAGDEDGEYVDSEVVMDHAGDLYGTTVSGGDFGSGTVWELSRNGTGWTHIVLYDFTGGADGSEPYKGVTLDAQGNLYGTTVTGGSGSCEGGCGVAYKLTNSGGKWTEKIIHAFTGGDDGSGPGAALTLDSQGNLYGTTPDGGANGLGVIFELHPNKSGHYALKVLHAFTGGADGATGFAGRLLLRGNHLYGVATAGGLYGSGAAYELTRASDGWSFATIYSFLGEPNAGFPYSALNFDRAGNLYGTTYYDGAYDFGSVYELSPTQSGEWSEQLLYSFTGGSDGSGPISNLVFDSAGNLYGTTSEGGRGAGTIFQLTPIAGSWTETTPHLFKGPPDGAFPYDGMTSDGKGNFYGATVNGGTADEGAIYEFTP